MIYKSLLNLLFLLCVFIASYAQSNNSPKGSLFIIGGGSRTPELIKKLIETANLNEKDYIVILPMASAEPDSSYYFIKKDLQSACNNTIANLNFTLLNPTNKIWLDSLEHAKLIFITGGDQNRFMNVVLHTPVYTAIHNAYKSGATIAGTSAGAAVMSEYMITGDQLVGKPPYKETFDKLLNKNIEFKEGLGLVTSAIIDQHFIVRSRYNRLISALAAFPSYACIGIDESTAIIIHNKNVVVTGRSQVLTFTRPKGLEIKPGGLIKFKKVMLSIYTDGDSFKIK
jgi:cyanophycinase